MSSTLSMVVLKGSSSICFAVPCKSFFVSLVSFLSVFSDSRTQESAVRLSKRLPAGATLTVSWRCLDGADPRCADKMP